MSLTDVGRILAEMVDDIADQQVEMLRRYQKLLASGIDRDAQRAVEEARDFRNLDIGRWSK